MKYPYSLEFPPAHCPCCQVPPAGQCGHLQRAGRGPGCSGHPCHGPCVAVQRDGGPAPTLQPSQMQGWIFNLSLEFCKLPRVVRRCKKAYKRQSGFAILDDTIGKRQNPIRCKRSMGKTNKNQLEKLEAAKAARLVCLGILNLLGLSWSFWVLHGKFLLTLPGLT